MSERDLWLASPGGDLVAGVSRDNRLRVYDTVKGVQRQKYVEKDHFSFRYTCMGWTRAVGWNDKDANKVVKAPKGSMGLLALGTDQGTVTVWDLTRGVVATKLGVGQNLKKITGVAFSADGKTIYTCSTDADVIEWDLKNGEILRRIPGDKHGATTMCFHPETNILAVARSSIHLIDASTGQRLRKIAAGHASSVSCLAFSNDGRYLATSSQGSRFVNIFDGKGPKKSTLATVALDDCPRSLDLHVTQDTSRPEGKVVCTIMVCYDTGRMQITRILASEAEAGQTATPVEQYVTKVISASNSSEDVSGVFAFLSRDDPTRTCCLLYGSEAGPLIVTPTYASDEGATQLLPVLSVAGDDALSLPAAGEDSKSRKRKKPEAVSSTLVKPTGHDPFEVDGDEEGGAALSKKAKTGEELTTIADRLEQLVDVLDKPDRALVAAGPSDSRALVAKGGRAPPKADSLVVVLEQSIKSGDEDLLETCLQVSDASVISKTIQRLNSAHSLPLLRILVSKVEKRPNRTGPLAVWIRQILHSHASYLMSVPSLHQEMEGLYQLVNRRVAVLPKLLGLAGRLDLMLSQITEPADKRGKVRKGPIMTYEDQDDDESDSEEEDGKMNGGEEDEDEEEEEEEDE